MKKRLWATLTILASVTLFSGCSTPEFLRPVEDALRKSPLAFLFKHRHEWVDDEDWSFDESGHWLECTDKTCTGKKEKKAHTYDNVCDQTCNDCGFERSAPHSYISEKHEATCEVDAYTIEVCKLCGAEGEIIDKKVGTALSHEWRFDYYVIVPNEDFCQVGGDMAEICDNCQTVKLEEVKAPGHMVLDIADWTVEKEPTKTENGLLVGPCALCKDDHATVEIPALKLANGKLNTKDYALTEILTNSSCLSRKGTETYTAYIDEFGKTHLTQDKASWKKISFTVTAEQFAHTLNGNAMDEAAYDIHDKKWEGISEYAGENASCKTGATGRGVFECEYCHKPCEVITEENHDWKYDVVTAPTCTEEGSGTRTCQRCGKKEVYPDGNPLTDEDNLYHKLGHKWEFRLEKTNAEGEEETFNVYAICTREGCGVREEYGAATGNVTSKIVLAATCNKEGVKEYSYSAKYALPGEEKAKDVKATLQEVIPFSAHKLNNKLMEGNVVDASLKGVTPFDGKEATCVVDGEGFYVCQHCNKYIPVIINKLDHPDEYRQTLETIEPTCTVDGCLKQKCTLCGQDGLTKSLPAGHIWEAKNLVAPTATATGSVIVDCKNCDESYEVTLPTLPQTTTALKNSPYTKTVIKQASCAKDGITKYTIDVLKYLDAEKYKDGGYEVSFEVVVKVENHGAADPVLQTYRTEPKKEGSKWYVYEYEGYICDTCKQLIVEGEPKKIQVDAPKK